MHPHAGVGCSEIGVVDLHAGVVVPKADVGNGHLDDGYESIVFAQAAFVELVHILEGYVQAAPIAPHKESGYHILPSSMFGRCTGLVTVVGAKEDVPGIKCATSKCLFYRLLLLIAYHEQGRLSVSSGVLDFSSVKKLRSLMSGSIPRDQPPYHAPAVSGVDQPTDPGSADAVF